MGLTLPSPVRSTVGPQNSSNELNFLKIGPRWSADIKLILKFLPAPLLIIKKLWLLILPPPPFLAVYNLKYIPCDVLNMLHIRVNIIQTIVLIRFPLTRRDCLLDQYISLHSSSVTRFVRRL